MKNVLRKRKIRKGQWMLIATFVLITAINLAIAYKYTLVGNEAKTFNLNKKNYESFISFSPSLKDLISSVAEVKREYRAEGGDFSCIVVFINKTNVSIFNGFKNNVYIKLKFLDRNVTDSFTLPSFTLKSYPFSSKKIILNTTISCIVLNAKIVPWVSGILVFSKNKNKDVLPLNAYPC